MQGKLLTRKMVESISQFQQMKSGDFFFQLLKGQA